MLKRVETEPIVVLKRSELLPGRRRKRQFRDHKGPTISGQIWKRTTDTGAGVLRDEDRVVKSERSGI